MAKSPNRETFMADAERLLREKFGSSSELVVWRGEYPHKYLDSEYIYDTILVGLSDNKDSPQPPTIIMFEAYLHPAGGVNYDFSVGGADDTGGSCPFGGGWNPLDCVKEIIPLLEAAVK